MRYLIFFSLFLRSLNILQIFLHILIGNDKGFQKMYYKSYFDQIKISHTFSYISHLSRDKDKDEPLFPLLLVHWLEFCNELFAKYIINEHCQVAAGCVGQEFALAATLCFLNTGWSGELTQFMFTADDVTQRETELVTIKHR